MSRSEWEFRKAERALCPNFDCGWGCWGDCKRISLERETTQRRWSLPDHTILSQLIEHGKAEVETPWTP